MIKRKFEEIPISTRTIIVSTDVEINIENLYNNLPITEYKVSEKKRGRKKKGVIEEIKNTVEDGSIVSIKYQGNIRGVDLRKKKKSNKFFRNAVTIILSVNNKLINLKITSNGKFQVTGCKDYENCQKAIKYLFDEIVKDKEKYMCKYGDSVNIIFNNVMTNKDFSVGFMINRENLDKIINNDTEYNSLLETSFGYTGVNLKMKLNKNIDRTFDCLKLDLTNNIYTNYQIDYQTYLKRLTDKELMKENKDRHITFLIFQSGNVIMSGMNENFMKRYYEIFYDIVDKNREQLVDKLEK